MIAGRPEDVIGVMRVGGEAAAADLDPAYLARMGESPSSIAHLLQLQAGGDRKPCGATRPAVEREEAACPEPRL